MNTTNLRRLEIDTTINPLQKIGDFLQITLGHIFHI